MRSGLLLLNLNGFYKSTIQPINNKPQNNSSEIEFLKSDWRLASSKCYIARECYWECVVHYPTSNISEVYKIISTEVKHISPIQGQTHAFIINISNQKTAVLYCCYVDSVIKIAQQYSLWRLLPESLPYYRHLFGKDKAYTTINYYEYIRGAANDVEKLFIEHEVLAKELIIKVDKQQLSSLPKNEHSIDIFSTPTSSKAALIDSEKCRSILTKVDVLALVDTCIHTYVYLKELIYKKKRVVPRIALFGVSLICTLVLGKSALLIWQEQYLSKKVESARTQASESIKLTNDLKKVKLDIIKINKNLNEHGYKSGLFEKLSVLINKKNQLKFNTINISPTEIQLRGTVKSAAIFLSTLSKVEGFSQVEFSSPPATIKTGGQRFNINLVYALKMSTKKTRELIK